MNKPLITTALMLLLSSTGYADTASEPDAAASTTPNQETTTEKPVADVKPTPAPTAEINVNDLNCNYHIPADTKEIAEHIIIHWAKQAAMQSFSFSPEKIQSQLDSLKPCFTDKGWTGFNDALEKSGNINAIKTQNLTVSSQIESSPSISDIKDDSWKVSVPLEVVYQNEKDKITQQLNVDVLVGRKPSGDLGILQIIATPKQTTDAKPSEEKSPAATTDAIDNKTAPTVVPTTSSNNDKATFTE